MYKFAISIFLIFPLVAFADWDERINDACCPGSCCYSPLAENGDLVINANKSVGANSLTDMVGLLSPWTTNEKKDNKLISESSEANQSNNNDPSNALIADYTGKLANYTEWLVFATIVLGIIGAVQGLLTYCQVKLGRQEFIASHRPKIKIHHIFPDGFIIGKKTTGRMLALNYGDSEAIIVNMVVDIFSRKLGEQAIFRTDTPLWLGIDPIEPGVMADIPFESQSILQHVAGNGIEYCVVGRLIYKDRNGAIRMTEFFRIYNLIGKRFVRTPQNHEYNDWEYES